MPRPSQWVGPETLESCVRRCLVSGARAETEPDRKAKERETILTRRTEQGLEAAPSIVGFNADNIARCSELYTHEELVTIAERHGVRATGSHIGLCARLLLEGLLNPQPA